ncbi:hypothetical protein ACHAXT_004798 [Thalassiosira profunda]
MIEFSNRYRHTPKFSADPPLDEPSNPPEQPTKPEPIPSKFRLAAKQRAKERCRQARRILDLQKDAALDHLLEHHITWAEDERTVAAKADTASPCRKSIDGTHNPNQRSTPVPILQRGRNLGYALSTTATSMVKRHLLHERHISFASQPDDIRHFDVSSVPAVTYDSGADDHYVSSADRTQAHLPILRKSSKRARVANGTISKAAHITKLPFRRLSASAAEAHEFPTFPDSLMSVSKTNDDGNVSIFTKDGVTMHREEDVLITLRGKPILVGVRDENDRYRIPLQQSRTTRTPRKPTKAAAAPLQQANSVYDLPSVEEGIQWMHATCGYPVKSTWLKAIKACNFHGWPLLSERAVRKYYPETTETPKGHMTQSRQGVRSTKSKPLEVIGNLAALKGWDKLLPQAEITLNLLRQSNATPTISAYAHLTGPFDFNKMPLAPLWCRVQIHEKADQRGTWDYHSIDGWYLATSPEHYRTHLCHVKSTRRDRFSDTVQFLHKNITNPTLTAADKVMHPIASCRNVLVKNGDAVPDEQRRDLEQLLEVASKRFGSHPAPTSSQFQGCAGRPTPHHEINGSGASSSEGARPDGTTSSRPAPASSQKATQAATAAARGPSRQYALPPTPGAPPSSASHRQHAGKATHQSAPAANPAATTSHDSF